MLCPFPSWPYYFLNVVVDEEMHLVLKTGHLCPFESMERLRYVDCVVGGIVGWRSETGHQIGWIDGGHGLVRDIGRGGRGMSVVHWILAELIGRRKDERANHFIRRDESH